MTRDGVPAVRMTTLYCCSRSPYPSINRRVYVPNRASAAESNTTGGVVTGRRARVVHVLPARDSLGSATYPNGWVTFSSTVIRLLSARWTRGNAAPELASDDNDGGELEDDEIARVIVDYPACRHSDSPGGSAITRSSSPRLRRTNAPDAGLRVPSGRWPAVCVAAASRRRRPRTEEPPHEQDMAVGRRKPRSPVPRHQRIRQHQRPDVNPRYQPEDRRTHKRTLTGSIVYPARPGAMTRLEVDAGDSAWNTGV